MQFKGYKLRIQFNCTVILLRLFKIPAFQPFPCISRLLAFAENAYKLTAVCKLCGQAAPFTHRKIETNQIEVIGGEEAYMAVCRDCYRDLNKTRFPHNEENGSTITKSSEARISLSGIENYEPVNKRARMVA